MTEKSRVRRDLARRHGVHPDPLSSVRMGHVDGQRIDPTLGGGITHTGAAEPDVDLDVVPK